MKKHGIRLLALLLCALILSGCGALQKQSDLSSGEYVHYSQMTYTRPDLAAMDQLLEDAGRAFQKDDLSGTLDYIYAFYDFYDSYFTNYSLAEIRYSGDLTDLYWEDEYSWCAENAAAVDAALEELYYALAKSPNRAELEGPDYFGPGFFTPYDGENNWDPAFTALLEQEADLQSRYYELSATAMDYEMGTDACFDACGQEMLELLVQLIGLRQQMAAHWGYADYPQFASDFYFYRDYTVAESARYLQEIARELVPLYLEFYDDPRWDAAGAYCSEEHTYAYLRETAVAMGGTVREAFHLMERFGLYDISYGENKYPSSFEVYLTSYYESFIFLCPSMTAGDKLTFAHEFGHFCNDYASYGAYVGTDVAEVFSQSMELLSLCYANSAGDLAWVKMADCLCLFVEQAAFASFEQRMYDLTGEELTAENLRALYRQVAGEFGFDTTANFSDWEFVTVNHYYTNPMYIISYVVSNDAALQLYQLELEESGRGLECFEANLATEQKYLLSFLESAGLESPFAPGRLGRVRQTLEQALK